MKRKIYDDLLKWKDSPRRKPLLLNGARQVGKTYILREFGRNEFANVVYLNLDIERERYASIFESSIEPSDIIARLEILNNGKIEPENTLIIFDEIQEVPRALTALKYFCERAPEYYVAASGSLLGVALHEGTSFPVGKVDTLELSPFDFEEFLMATSNERFLRIVGSPKDLELFSDKMENLFRQYLIVGGMPEAINVWVETQDYGEVDKVQNAILLAYLNDISKHTDATTATRIHQVWNSLPAQFAKRNEKFMFNVIKNGARAREYEVAVQWLVDCSIVRKVERIKTGDKLPLPAYVDTGAFKLYFLDVGLFRHLSGVTTDMILDNEILFREFNGFFVEQFVLQQMAGKYQMYYWTSESDAEVDFVTEYNNGVLPIEVKSGTNVKAKSMKTFRDEYEPKIAVRFSLKPVEYNNGLLNLPVYLAGFVEEYLKKYKNLEK